MIKNIISIVIAILAIASLILSNILPDYSNYFIILCGVFVIFQLFIEFVIFKTYEVNALTTDKNNEELMKFVSNKFYRILINRENKIYYLSNKTRKELNLNIFDSILKYIPERILLTEYKEIKVEIFGNLYMYYRVLNTIYLWPINEQEKYKKLYSESVNGVGYLLLDNYRELTAELSEAKKYEYLSKFYFECEQLFNKYNIIGKKISTTKYFFVATIGSYRKLKNDGFIILDRVSTIYENDVESLSCSIGFSINQYNNSNFEDERSAQNALNLAVERGGDQVVENINGELKIIGGNTHTNIVRSKVRVRIFAKDILKRIKDANQIQLFGHHNIDMDCFSSLISTYEMIKTIDPNKKVTICAKVKGSSFDVRNAFDKLPSDVQSDFVLHPLVNKDTLVIILDVSTFSNIYEGKEIIKTENIVIIDHHLRDKDDAIKDARSLLDVNASSTAELLIELMDYTQMLNKLSKVALNCLYTGIIIDTDNLLQKVSTNTFNALSSLIRIGANVNESFELRQDSYDFVKEMNNVIINSVPYKDKYVIAYSPFVWTDTKVAKTANKLLELRDFDCSFVIAKTKRGIKISARSNGKVHVGNIMKKLKGGGHATIAAAMLPHGTINIESKIKNILDSIDK